MNNKYIIFIIISMLLTQGCQPTSNVPEDNIAQVIEPKIEDTLIPTIIPTITPYPTFTPKPTATKRPPTPTIEFPFILTEYFNDAYVKRNLTFDNMSGWHTYNSGTGSLVDGEYAITGQPGWASGLVRDKKFKEGEGVIVDFMFTVNTRFEFIMDRGKYQTDSYRRFGVFGFDYPQANLTQGKNALGYKNLSGNFRPLPNTMYSYLVGIGFEGDFIAIIWNPADISQLIIYREVIGEKWDDFEWEFTAKVSDTGMVMILDNFREIVFDEIIW